MKIRVSRWVDPNFIRQPAGSHVLRPNFHRNLCGHESILIAIKHKSIFVLLSAPREFNRAMLNMSFPGSVRYDLGLLNGTVPGYTRNVAAGNTRDGHHGQPTRVTPLG